jgi:hypothetical protein
VLAYFDADGLSNGGNEAINMLIEKARRLAHGYRNFENYRLRMLLAASGTPRPTSQNRDLVTTLKSEEPDCAGEALELGQAGAGAPAVGAVQFRCATSCRCPHR